MGRKKPETEFEQSIRRIMESVLQSRAYKSDLKKTIKEVVHDVVQDVLNKNNFVTRDHFDRAIKQVVLRPEFEDAVRDLKETMVTKEEFYHRMDLFEPMLAEFRDFQITNVLTGRQLCDMDDTIANHEKRIRVLES